MSRQPDEECNCLLGDNPLEDKLEDLSRGICVASVDSVKARYFEFMNRTCAAPIGIVKWPEIPHSKFAQSQAVY